MDQVAKFKRTWDLVPVFQIVRKIHENYCSCFYLSIGHVWGPNELWFKRYIQKCTVSYTNTHHDVTDLVNHGTDKNTKTWISWQRNITFFRNKEILNLCLRWHILRSYLFVAEVALSRWPASLLKMSLFHKCFSNILLVKTNYLVST